MNSSDRRPILTWRAAAKVLGISEDALGRARREYGDRMRRCWFEDADAVKAWWKALIMAPAPVQPSEPAEPPPEPPPRPKPPARPRAPSTLDDRPLDLAELRSSYPK